MEPTLEILSGSFERHLLATNHAPRTLHTYLCAIRALGLYLEGAGHTTEVRALRKGCGIAGDHNVRDDTHAIAHCRWPPR